MIAITTSISTSVNPLVRLQGGMVDFRFANSGRGT